MGETLTTPNRSPARRRARLISISAACVAVAVALVVVARLGGRGDAPPEGPSRSVRVAGVVIDGVTRLPVLDATVELTSAGAPLADSVLLGPTGGFHIATEASSIDVAARAPDGRVGRARVTEGAGVEPVVIALHAPAAIEVQVSDELNAAVAGARVELHFVQPRGIGVAASIPSVTPEETHGAIAAERTDASGFVEFGNLAPGVWRAILRDEFWAVEGARVEVAPGEKAVVRVRAVGSATVRGRVLGADGEAVAGASIRIVPTSVVRDRGGEDAAISSSTDASGAFALERIPPGAVTVFVARDGVTWRRWAEAQVQPGGETRLMVVMRRDERIACRVLAAGDSRPLESIEVRAVLANDAGVLRGRSDADGRVDFLIPAGSRISDLRVHDLAWDAVETQAPHATTPRLGPAPRWASWVLRLAPRRRVTGRVTVDGLPAESALVTITSAAPGARGSSQTAVRHDGTFEALAVAGAPLEVRVALPWCPPVSVTVDAGHRPAVLPTIELFAGRHLAGRVVLRGGGDSVPDVLVLARAEGRTAVARTDGNGRFVLAGIEGGRSIDVTARSPLGVTSPVTRAIADADDVRIELPVPRTMSIRLDDPEILSWRVVAVRSAEHWSWKALPAAGGVQGDTREPTVSVTIPETARESLVVLESIHGRRVFLPPLAVVRDGPISVRLPPEEVVTVVAVDEDGRPLAGAGVSLRYQGHPGADDGMAIDLTHPVATVVGTTDGRGVCVVTGLQDGAYEVTCSSARFIDARGSVVLPSADPLRMQMQESTSLRGRVRVEPDGRAVGGAIVRASWPAAGTEPQEATTGIDGTFEFADAPSAPAVLLVLPPLDGSTNLMPKRIDVTGTTSDLDVVVRPGATISGRVVDSDRNPLAGAMVSASMSGGMDSASVISAITNERGGFELVGLEARDYDLQAASPRAISTATKSSIAAGETRVTLLLDTSRDADRSR